MANGYIGQIHIGETDYKIGSTLFAVLDTASNIGSIVTNNSTTTFNVPLDGFVLTNGVTIHIQFKQSWVNSVNSTIFRLKVGETAAAPIENPNGAIIWYENSVISFTYDGTNYIMNTVGFDASNITIDMSQLSNLTLGNIQSTGALQTNDITIDAGDKLVITDASDNNKIARASLAFTAPITTQNQSTTFLRSDGTWAVPSYTTDTNTRRSIKVNDTEILSSSSTTALNLVNGSNISITNSSGTVTIANTYSYTLPLAASGTRGGIQIGYTTSDKNYAVQLDNNEKAYVNVPWTDTKVTQAYSTTNSSYPILFSATSGISSTNSRDATTAIVNNAIYANPADGAIYATYFYGDGSNLTNVTASSVALTNVTEADDLKAIEALTGTSGLLKKTAANTWTLDTTSYATSAEVNGLLAAADAMTFKGTIGADGTINTTNNETLPTTHTAGDTYKVITAGIYAGQVCEVGDLIICIKDVTNASNAANSDWTVTQTNIDGAVTGPTTSTANHIATFNDGSGKIIKDSGYTIATSVPSGAIFTDKKVEQKKYTSDTNSEFRLLFKKSANNTDETDLVYYSDINNKNITYNPHTGTLSAAIFKGSLDTSVLGTDSSVTSALTFYHKSGNWKTLQITNTTTTIASVSNGVLTLAASVKENAILGIAT